MAPLPRSPLTLGRRRLLWVNHFAVAPHDGGGTRHFEVARELVRRGWDVTIAASDFSLQERRYTRRRTAHHRAPIVEEVEGVRFVWLWSAPYRSNNWRRGWNWLTFSRSLLGLAPEGEWDVVIGSSPHLFAAVAARRLARRMGVPFVFEVRDLWPESLLAAGGRSGPFHLVLDRLARSLYRDADHIVVLAEGSADYLTRERGVDPGRISFVPNGVDPAAFDRVASENGGAPPTAPHSERRTVFVYAGAHGAANGLHAVVDAAAELRGRRDVVFRLIGDGPEKPRLRERAELLGLTNIEFIDPIPKSRIPAAFAAADVGLMVLRDAPLFRFAVSPNKLFDYFAARLPVLANVPGEVGQMVEEAGAGIVVAAESGRALAAGVAHLADETPEIRRRRGEAGRAWVERERSREVLADRLDAVLRPLADR